MFSIEQIKSFNALEMELYDYILSHKEKVVYMTIRELAAEVGTSSTSILRFCHKLGCNGFMEFKVNYKHYLENAEVKVSYTDDKVSIFEDFLAKVKTPAFMDRVDKAIQLISSKNKLFCIGVGPTGSIAAYASACFSASGCFSVYLDDHFLSQARSLSADNYMIFCVSGESRETEQFMRRIHEAGGHTILITNSANCPLVEFSDAYINYNLYYAKSIQEPASQKPQISSSVLDVLTTQLPTVYVIELIAKILAKDVNLWPTVKQGDE